MLADWTEYLNQSVEYAWRPDAQRPELIWPYTIKTTSGVTVTSGAFALTVIENSDFWRLWTADNRDINTTPRPVPIPDTTDGTNIYVGFAGVTSVFVWYRAPRPQFSSTLVVSTRTYAVGDLVYDSQISLTATTITSTSTSVAISDTTGVRTGMAIVGAGIPAGAYVASFVANTSITLSAAATVTGSSVAITLGSGNVYKCAVAALGSSLVSSASSWTAQSVPDPLTKIVLSRAEGYRVKSKANDPATLFAESDKYLAEEKERSLPDDGSPPPWEFSFAVS